MANTTTNTAIQTAHDLNGLAVVALNGGERLGRIEDILFAPASGTVVGFLVDRGGMFSKPQFLAAADVQGLGADALTIASETVLKAPAPATAAGVIEVAAKSLNGRPVLSPTGTVLGKVADTAVDTSALTVPYLILATGLLDNTLHGKPHLPIAAIQTVGADSVIVTASYDPNSLQAH